MSKTKLQIKTCNYKQRHSKGKLCNAEGCESPIVDCNKSGLCKIHLAQIRVDFLEHEWQMNSDCTPKEYQKIR